MPRLVKTRTTLAPAPDPLPSTAAPRWRIPRSHPLRPQRRPTGCVALLEKAGTLCAALQPGTRRGALPIDLGRPLPISRAAQLCPSPDVSQSRGPKYLGLIRTHTRVIRWRSHPPSRLPPLPACPPRSGCSIDFVPSPTTSLRGKLPSLLHTKQTRAYHRHPTFFASLRRSTSVGAGTFQPRPSKSALRE